MIVTPRPDLDPPPQLGYSASRIDRVAHLRGDDAALQKFSTHPQAGLYVIGGELVVLKASSPACDPLFAPAEARTLGVGRDNVFLGLMDDAPRFGFGLEAQAIESLKSRNDLKITDLRSIAVQGMVAAEHLPPLAEAKALIGWHTRHRFCPNCGAPTQVVLAGWRRDCPACKAQHFPRTDPVVIMLPIAGERCVLGRSAALYAEHVVVPRRLRRAGRNDRGGGAPRNARRGRHRLRPGRYFASQPWPFPMSLMIGCHAQALSDRNRRRSRASWKTRAGSSARNWRRC